MLAEPKFIYFWTGRQKERKHFITKKKEESVFSYCLKTTKEK
jgi:hypothetical protein